MGDLWLPAFQGWNSTDNIIQALMQPFTTAAQLASALGGAQFLYTVFCLSAIVYSWWHAKDPYPAGVVALILGAVGTLFAELRFWAWLVLGIGAALIVYRIGREMWG